MGHATVTTIFRLPHDGWRQSTTVGIEYELEASTWRDSVG